MRTLPATGNGTPPDGALVPYGYDASPIPISGLRPPASGVRRYVTFLKKKWWIVLLSVIFFASLAAAYVIWWPASYTCIAHMWIAGRTGLHLQEGATYDEENVNFIGTQIELIESDLILGRALHRVQNTLHLAVTTNSEGKPKMPTIRVSQLPKSAVLEVKAKGTSPAFVQAFLNAAMDEFLAYKKEITSGTSGDTYNSVSEKITRQEADLKTAQDKLNVYMRENNVAVLEEQAKAASAYLTQLLAQLSQTKMEYQLLEALSNKGPLALAARTNVIAIAPDVWHLVPGDLPSASPPPEFLTAQQNLQKLMILRNKLSRYLRPEHPRIVKLDQEIFVSEKLVGFLSDQSYAQIENATQTAKMKIDQIQATINEWEAKVNDTSERIAEYERIKLNVDGLQSLHDRLLGLLQTVDVSRNLDQQNINILDRASGANNAKKTAYFAALLIFLGVGVGLALVFLVERLDNRIMSFEELESRFDECIVGQVPEITSQAKGSTSLLELNDPRSMYAESYRGLRSALLYLPTEGERPKVMLITSAVPHEGKSTIAANLARTLASGGSRVLLVDADLRRGHLHKMLGLQDAPGLVELLQHPGDLESFIQVNPRQNFAFLSRGTALGHTSDLFLGMVFDGVLAQMRQKFDYVLIDSSPVLAADDATSLAPKMDGVLMVVRGSFAASRTIRQAMELLYERQAKVMGLVFNRADIASSSYECYKYADYHCSDETA